MVNVVTIIVNLNLALHRHLVRPFLLGAEMLALLSLPKLYPADFTITRDCRVVDVQISQENFVGHVRVLRRVWVGDCVELFVVGIDGDRNVVHFPDSVENFLWKAAECRIVECQRE